MNVTVNPDRCIACRACEKDCTASAFSHEGNGPSLVTGERCIHCGHCFAVCPAGAITLDGFEPNSQPAVVSAPLNDAQRDMLFRARRSVRSYEQEPVDVALLNRALELANNAPTARNQREVHWTVFNGREKLIPIMHEVAEVHSRGNGPYAQMVSAVKLGLDPVLRGAPCLVLAHAKPWIWAEVDCTVATTYLELALHSLGLGACWSGMVISALRQGPQPSVPLPEDHVVYAGLMVGRPKTLYHYLAPRQSPAVRFMD